MWGAGFFRRSATPLHLYKHVTRFVSDSWISCFPRDAMLKPSLLSAGVRPSVRPSSCIVWRRLKIVKLLYRPCSPSTLVLWPRAPIPNCKGNPFSGGVNYTGYGKIRDPSTPTIIGGSLPFMPTPFIAELPNLTW